MKLKNKLNKLNSLPFHMPGHKRNEKFGISGSEIDITEIEGFDNLHSPDGIILDIENRLTDRYKSKKSFLLVNGSTVGMLSAIFAVCDEGDKIIASRNCHKSVYNACMLKKLRVIFVEPEFDFENGYYKKLSQTAIDEAINNNPDAKAVVITSPTYEGIISDIKSPLPLIIDAAHGAHLGLYGYLNYPKGDIVVSSLHKTLPALTQTAVLNVYNESYIEKVKLFLDIFETSSPSYVLMNSVDICLDYIKGAKNAFLSFLEHLKDIHNMPLHVLKIRECDDISKIVISTANSDISGKELSVLLKKEANIEVEAVSKNYVLLMTSVGNEKADFDTLKAALIRIDRSLKKAENKPFIKPYCPKEEIVISKTGGKLTDFKDALGKVSDEFIFAYPPDIPFIVPNETITKEALEYLSLLLESEVNVMSDSSNIETKILTK